MKNLKETTRIFTAFAVFVILIFFIFVADISPDETETIFVVPNNSTSTEAVAEKLASESFIGSKWLFKTISSVAGLDEIEPGGYTFKKGVNLFKVVDIFSSQPGLIWVSIPEGLRKEEIASIIGEKLNWNEGDRSSFVNFHTSGEYTEGVYFPETYLIPKGATGPDVAERMIAKFNEKFEKYAEKFMADNIKWTTGLKLASIVQREAASDEEMPLVAGILWNRLLDGMKLQVDATLQYATGKNEGGWWAPIDLEDKDIDSPYNTYKYEGLPPTPISNPGLPAIEAALNPEETDCIYYIHAKRQIYCSNNYEEHMDNINKYLK